VDDWFAQLAGVHDPNREHLGLFLDEVMRFLGYVIRDESAYSLWVRNPQLQRMAIDSYETDLRSRAEELRAAIRDIPERALVQHGLIGRSAVFKYNVLATVSLGWGRRRRGRIRRLFTVRGGFRRVVEAIDAVLASLIDAAGGAGGAIKEFKDALLALAPEK
jgi:hypothetical protein